MKQRKYYWIKLKVDFFKSEEIDFLLSQKNGAEYVVLYQMLCLQTANSNGKLETQVGEMLIPYDIDKIVRDTKHFDIDTVTVALELYKKLNLIYKEENNILQITNHTMLVGSESATKEAIKKRIYRAKQKEVEEQGTQVGTQVGTNCPTEYRDKSIENRDKILDNIYISQNKIKFEKEFETLWKLYPNKTSKEKAKEHYIKSRKSKTTFEDIQNGLNHYLEYINQNDWYTAQNGSTWFNHKNKHWENKYELKQIKETQGTPYKTTKGGIQL